MIALIARMKVQAGKEQAFEQLMGELASQVSQHEEGCTLYQLCKAKQAQQYVVLERYVSKDALGAHGQSPHFLQAMPKLGELLDGRPDIEVLEEVG